MARKRKIIPGQLNEKIHISVFKDIHVHFPGDVYLLATWMAMSDLARSTPTHQQHTTLRGLAIHFSTLYGIDYNKPLTVEDMLEIFRSFGITGNPQLTLENPEKYTFSDDHQKFAHARIGNQKRRKMKGLVTFDNISDRRGSQRFSPSSNGPVGLTCCG